MASPAASSPAAAALASMKQLVPLRQLLPSYFRLSAGQRSEPVFVRVYVLAIVAGGTAYLAIQAVMPYQLLTALLTGVPPLPGARPTIAQTLETWVVSLFALTVESYYVYRAALTYIFAATWAFTTDGLLCASILLYELVYKRRSSVVRIYGRGGEE
ncbi:hypothetical protein JCM10296v2_002213 [Rhodotorula toruloides]